MFVGEQNPVCRACREGRPGDPAGGLGGGGRGAGGFDVVFSCCCSRIVVGVIVNVHIDFIGPVLDVGGGAVNDCVVVVVAVVDFLYLRWCSL